MINEIECLVIRSSKKCDSSGPLSDKRPIPSITDHRRWSGRRGVFEISQRAEPRREFFLSTIDPDNRMIFRSSQKNVEHDRKACLGLTTRYRKSMTNSVDHEVAKTFSAQVGRELITMAIHLIAGLSMT